MTRKEAIINLKLSQNRIGGIKKEEWNALQMAIEALQGGDAEILNEDFRPKYMQQCPNGADLISRADAICEVLVNDGINNIVDRINALPSADAVKRSGR